MEGFETNCTVKNSVREECPRRLKYLTEIKKMFASISDSYMCSFYLWIDFSIQCVCVHTENALHIYVHTSVYIVD